MEEIIEKPSYTHKQFAVSCFNKVWELLELENRSASETVEMVHLCHSSFWHWTQVEEHTPTNLSVGYWQLSRVYSVIEQGNSTLYYAERCIEISNNSELGPFYLAYAYEAAARAYKTLKEIEKCEEMLKNAKFFTDQAKNDESKGWLINDLESILKN